jgi:hypothetical protein
LQAFHEEYTELRGARFAPVPVPNPIYVGGMPAAAMPFLK